jgi:hypothetical protein
MAWGTTVHIYLEQDLSMQHLALIAIGGNIANSEAIRQPHLE